MCGKVRGEEKRLKGIPKAMAPCVENGDTGRQGESSRSRTYPRSLVDFLCHASCAHIHFKIEKDDAI